MNIIEYLKNPAENPYAFLASLSKKGRDLYCADLYERWIKKVEHSEGQSISGQEAQPT